MTDTPAKPAQQPQAKPEPDRPTHLARQEPPTPRTPRRTKRRRPIRVVRAGRWRTRLILLLVLITLIFVGYLIAERIRTGDMPRSMAQSVISSALGLRVEIGSVDLAWSGQTSIRDIIVRLPLDDTPLIEIDQINATHRHLALIAILRDPGLGHLELEGVRVLLERDQDGSWNLLDALGRIAATRSAGEGGNASVPTLPHLRADTITIQLRDDGQDLGQLNAQLTGDPESTAAYAFALHEPTIGTMTGRIAVAGNWSHRINFELRSLGPIEELLRTMLPEPENQPLDPIAATATGRWNGQLADGGLRGALSLEAADATAAGRRISAQGEATLTIANRIIAIEPRGIRVWSDALADAELLSGTLRLTEGRLEFDRLRARSLGTTADVDGTWRIAREAGAFDLVWSGHEAGPVTAHHGRASITIAASEAGRSTLRGTTDATIEIGRNRLRAELDLDATALLPDRASGGLRFRRLSWSGPDESPIELAGFEAGIALAEGVARLTRLRIPGATLESTKAEYTIADGSWLVDIATTDWLVPRLQELGSVALSVRASGQADRAEQWSLTLRNARAFVDASGSYDPDRDTPLIASTQIAIQLADASASTTEQPDPAPPLITCGVRAHLDLAGSLEPIALVGASSIILSNLSIRGTTIEPLTINGIGQLDADGLDFSSEALELLGGSAQLIGSLARDATVGVRVNASRMIFDELNEALGIGTPPGGHISVDLELNIPQGDAGRATIVGNWSAGEMGIDPIAIDLASGRIEADRREARLEDITLERADGRINGRITYDLATETGLNLDFEAHRWPIESGELGAVIDGSLRGSIDLATMSADLTLDGSGQTTLNDTHLGGGTLSASVLGQTVHIESSNLEVGGGRINATGTVPITAWTETNLDATIEGVSLSAIAQRFVSEELAQLLTEFSGTTEARLVVAPNTGSQPFGPLGITLNGRLVDGGFRLVGVDGFEIRIATGPERTVLERAVLQIADGTIEAWGTTTMHADERFIRLNAAISRIDLDQIARSADPTMGAVPGRVSGSVVAGGYLRAPNRLFGESVMTIEESDLANVGSIAMLYNALNVGNAGREPRGRGTASIRLEGEALDVTRFEYFNRGVDVFATLRLHQVLAGMDSPLTGYAGGSARPLKDLELPFADTVDRMLTTAQSDAVSVVIGGTLGQRTMRIVPFSEAFGGLSRMLGTNQPPPEER